MPNTANDDEIGDTSRYRLQSVERALDTLELLATAGPDGMTLTELTERLAVSKSSAFALLHTLIARGYVADSGSRLSRRYRLGMELAKLGDAASDQSPLVSVTMPVLQSVTDETGLTTRLVIPDGPYAIVAARVDAPGTVRFALHVGRQGAARRADAGARPGDGGRGGPAGPDPAHDHRSRRADARPGAERGPRLHDRR
jgi:hypothetical protein